MHPEWRPIAVSAGHMSGSVIVLFEAKPAGKFVELERKLAAEAMTDREMLEAASSPQGLGFAINKPKRGRPPKVKVAV